MKDNREDFETWAKTQYLDLDYNEGGYTERCTGTAWYAWQAGYSQCESDNSDTMC